MNLGVNNKTNAVGILGLVMLGVKITLAIINQDFSSIGEADVVLGMGSITALVAKDRNVTGGTKPNIPVK